MRTLSTLVSAVALISATAICQTVHIPSAVQGPANGTSGNYFTAAGINRFQMIYDSATFTAQGVLQPISITNVEFEWGGATALVVATFPSVSVFLQPAAVDYAAQSTTYATNRSIAFPTAANYAGPATTQAGTYYVSIPLTTPFSYDPTLGVDLLIEVEVNGAATPATGNSQLCTVNGAVPANFCNVKRSVGSLAATVGTHSAFVPLLNLTYIPAPNAGIATPLGSGCISKYASIYEEFAAPVNFDLQNSALTFIPVGTTYLVTRTGAWLPIGSVQAVPTVLSLADDAEVFHTFTTGSFPGWTGLNVCSNAYISQGAGNSLTANPAPGQLMNGNPQTAFYCQLDLDPITPGLGAGTIQVEESAAVTTVTWNGVTNWNNPVGGSGAAPCDIQFQFYATGEVAIAWGANFTPFTSNGGVIVGYSPGGANLVPASTNISAMTTPVLLEVADTFPLALTSLTRPVINTNWNLEVSNIPQIPAQFGVEIYGFTDPNIADLFFIGAPGCGLRANLDILNPWVNFAPATTHAYSLAVPNSLPLIGTTFFLQSAMLDASYNGFGAITSNGISGLIGSI